MKDNPEMRVEEAEGEGVQERNPELSLWVVVVLLVVATVFVTVTAEYLVESMDRLTMDGKISKEFTGLILLPIVTGGPEHVDIIVASRKGKLDQSMTDVVGGVLVGFLLLEYSTVGSPPSSKICCLLSRASSFLDGSSTNRLPCSSTRLSQSYSSSPC